MRTGAAGIEIARRLDVTEGQVSLWRSSQRKPSLPNRKGLFDLYGIPIESWDEAIPDDDRPTGKKPVPAWGDGVVRARIDSLISIIDEIVVALRDDKAAAPLEKAKVIKSLGPTLRDLAKLTGELGRDAQVDEAQILRSARWKTIESALLEALRPHPEALRACGEALARIDKAA